MEIKEYKKLIYETSAKIREEEDTLELYLTDSNGKEKKYSHIVFKNQITQYRGDIKDLIELHLKKLLIGNNETDN